MENPFLKLGLLVLLDVVVLWLGVWYIDPDPSVSISLLILVPAVFICNIIIAIILAVLKKRNAGLFVLNALVASILLFFLFDAGIDRHQHRLFESWTFTVNDTAYNMVCWKQEPSFSITKYNGNGGSEGVAYGAWIAKGEDIYLQAGVALYVIKGKHLYGFGGDVIPMNKQ